MMRRAIIASLGVAAMACLLPSATMAQEFTIDAHLIDRCLAVNGDTPLACVGREADQCSQRHGGGSNMIVAACQKAELTFWDNFLNDSYTSVLALAQAAEESDVGYAPGQLTDAVRQMQRSWIVYRDTTCDVYVTHAAPFGSAAGPVETECLMRQTARQVFQLIALAGKFRS